MEINCEKKRAVFAHKIIMQLIRYPIILTIGILIGRYLKYLENNNKSFSSVFYFLDYIIIAIAIFLVPIGLTCIGIIVVFKSPILAIAKSKKNNNSQS